MKNKQLTKLVDEIINTPRMIVVKGNVGGNSIEVFTQTPYDDRGSIVYQNAKDRDNDFDALQELVKTSRVN